MLIEHFFLGKKDLGKTGQDGTEDEELKEARPGGERTERKNIFIEIVELGEFAAL